ncbi:MAG: hypothetical protein H6Q73_3508 [Firmicutes bacterium]|nr:hypothetical protein [Bacillota bacterium]
MKRLTLKLKRRMESNIRSRLIKKVHLFSLTGLTEADKIRMEKLYSARIILRIWLKSLYRVTVNYLTTSESVPRVPHSQSCLCDLAMAATEWYRCYQIALHRWDKSPGGEVSLIYEKEFPCSG